MSQVYIVYWSGTGNTAAMADFVAEGVKAGGAEAVVLRLALEYADVSLAAEQDHLLFNDRDAVKLLEISGSEARLTHNLYIYTY